MLKTYYSGRVKVMLSAEPAYQTYRDTDGVVDVFENGAVVCARTLEGQKWYHTTTFDDMQAAWDFCAYVNQVGGTINLDARDDVGYLYWQESSQVYGSALYLQSGEEQAWLEREMAEIGW